jgi:hypothetical protein
MRSSKVFAGMLAIACAALASSKASADLIINGDFESGDTGFTTGYVENSIHNGGLDQGNPGPHGDNSGTYGIMQNSQDWHSSFDSFGDHTTTDGSGHMMIFNGSEDPDVTLWQQTVNGTTVGDTYVLSFYAASAYSANPANINITASINALAATFQLTSTTAVWQHFSMTFVSQGDPTTIRLADSILQANGNDFAIDDISLCRVSNANVDQQTSVPLPASAWGGLLLVGALAGTRGLNRLRQAHA